MGRWNVPPALDVFSRPNVSSKQQLVWSGLYEPFVASAKRVFSSAETSKADEIAGEPAISIASPEWEAAELPVLSASPAPMLLDAEPESDAIAERVDWGSMAALAAYRGGARHSDC